MLLSSSLSASFKSLEPRVCAQTWLSQCKAVIAAHAHFVLRHYATHFISTSIRGPPLSTGESTIVELAVGNWTGLLRRCVFPVHTVKQTEDISRYLNPSSSHPEPICQILSAKYESQESGPTQVFSPSCYLIAMPVEARLYGLCAIRKFGTATSLTVEIRSR